jgi:hypothetical protein
MTEVTGVLGGLSAVTADDPSMEYDGTGPLGSEPNTNGASLGKDAPSGSRGP